MFINQLTQNQLAKTVMTTLLINAIPMMQSNTLSRVVLYLSTIVEYRHSKIIQTAPTSRAPNIAIHSKNITNQYTDGLRWH